MKNKIKKRIKSALEGTLFESVSKELLENLDKKIKRILREEDYEYRNITVGFKHRASENWVPLPYVEIYPLYERKIVVSIKWEGHNGQK